jgi:thiamine biosynthesis lipoprotein
VEALQRAGATRGWVNAGGDLRAFGDLELPIRLRDETSGGVREFGQLRDGALATSRFGADAHSRLTARAATGCIPTDDDGREAPALHLSVVAPRCIWADALTKVVALLPASTDAGRRGGRAARIDDEPEAVHRLLAEHGAQAWAH